MILKNEKKGPSPTKFSGPQIREVSFLEIKNINISELENNELLDVQKQIQSFLKFLDSEYENIKKLEEENS